LPAPVPLEKPQKPRSLSEAPPGVSSSSKKTKEERDPVEVFEGKYSSLFSHIYIDLIKEILFLVIIFLSFGIFIVHFSSSRFETVHDLQTSNLSTFLYKRL
jgi:hypothetical protein